MVNDQHGEVKAYDSDSNRVFGVFDTSEEPVPFWSNKNLFLDFEDNQNVTSVDLAVSSNVQSVIIEYWDENGDVVVSKKIAIEIKYSIFTLSIGTDKQSITFAT